MHNAIFDCAKTTRNFGVELMPSLHADTMVMAHLVDENSSIGLKELSTKLWGDSAKQEQEEMKASIEKNGGRCTEKNYELYKADSELIAKYGAKDTILTLKLFNHLSKTLRKQKLEDFFYKEESMPLLKGPTYEMNTTGLQVDFQALLETKQELEKEIANAKVFIYDNIKDYVIGKYPGTNKKNTFNITSNAQLAWLIYGVLGLEFGTLTKEGKIVCRALGMAQLPYTAYQKKQFALFLAVYQ